MHVFRLLRDTVRQCRTEAVEAVAAPITESATRYFSEGGAGARPAQFARPDDEHLQTHCFGSEVLRMTKLCRNVVVTSPRHLVLHQLLAGRSEDCRAAVIVPHGK
jgi:hypothetical protein